MKILIHVGCSSDIARFMQFFVILRDIRPDLYNRP